MNERVARARSRTHLYRPMDGVSEPKREQDYNREIWIEQNKLHAFTMAMKCTRQPAICSMRTQTNTNKQRQQKQQQRGKKGRERAALAVFCVPRVYLSNWLSVCLQYTFE